MELKLIKEFEEILNPLNAGHFRKINEFVICRAKTGRFQVNGYLPYNTIEEIPKTTLKDHLSKIKDKFAILINDYPFFKEIILNCGVDYYAILDYQTGGVTVCFEKNGEYKEFI